MYYFQQFLITNQWQCPLLMGGHGLFAVTSRWRSVNATWELWLCSRVQNCLSAPSGSLSRGVCVLCLLVQSSNRLVFYMHVSIFFLLSSFFFYQSVIKVDIFLWLIFTQQYAVIVVFFFLRLKEHISINYYVFFFHLFFST